MSQRLNEAIEEFQGIARAVVTASAARSNPDIPFPEGFEFMKYLPEPEVTALGNDISVLAQDIKKKLAGVAAVQPLLAYNMAIRSLKNKCGVYSMVAMLNKPKELK